MPAGTPTTWCSRGAPAGREDIIEARDNDRQEKERMRNSKDNRDMVKEYAILIGDKVLLRSKITKHTGQGQENRRHPEAGQDHYLCHGSEMVWSYLLRQWSVCRP